jgi:hypothetical protein
MATMIRASCTDCGDVELTTHDVRVRVCSDVDASTYVFRCPTCQMAVVKPAEQRVIDLLIASGVALDRWTLPAELNEPRVGEPITHDDLIDFHRLLGSDDWYDRLHAELRPSYGSALEADAH